MLSIKELREKSLQLGIPIESIDKDWVLGHFLNGMFKDVFFKEHLVFKGGTCLRKIYFENYRFSEDLDFTAVREFVRSELIEKLTLITDSVYQDVGISFGPIQCKDLLSNDRLMEYQLRIPFWGSLHPKHKKVEHKKWTTSIKIDISLNEILLKPIVSQKILHQYSDQNLMTEKIQVYCLEEIYSEKLRSLLQRSYSAPRDYYDLWYIATYFNNDVKWKSIPSLFEKKCSIKKIVFNDVSDFFGPKRVASAESEWQPSLGGHLRELPDVDIVLMQLKENLKTLFRT